MSEENFTEEQVQLSKEQLAQRRKEITEFYKSNIPHLKAQKEYEQLLTEIEELRAKRIQAQMFLAQAYAADKDPEVDQAAEDFEKAMAENEPEEESPRRTLKRS
jgi:outer membrane protein assembly factor BamD (BamD/ComL family)